MTKFVINEAELAIVNPRSILYVKMSINSPDE